MWSSIKRAVVWCGMVCRRRCYRKAMAGMVLHAGNASREGCVSRSVRCVLCVVHLWQGGVPLSDAGRLLSKAVLGTLPDGATEVLAAYRANPKHLRK